MTTEFYTESKKKFSNFFNSLSEVDRVGIFVHANCLDGMASAIFLHEILRAKGIKHKKVEFFEYSLQMVKSFKKKADENNLNKIVLADIGASEVIIDEFEEFIEERDLLYVDHHSPSQKLRDSPKVIKAEGRDCASWMVYEFGRSLFDAEKWEWLLYPAMIHEFAQKKKEHFDFIKEKYPRVKEDGSGNSEPEKLMKELSFVIGYYKDNLGKAFEIIKNKDFENIEAIQKKMSKEFNYWVEKFKNEKEVYPEADLYVYYYNPKYNLGTSGVTTSLSISEPDKIWMSLSDLPNEKAKVSIRSNGGLYDLNELVLKSIEDIEGATGGGHRPAGGAVLPKKDLEKFKQNLIKAIIEAKNVRGPSNKQEAK